MLNFKSSLITASDLLTDDWFKLGGFLYRIGSVNNSFAETTIIFHRADADVVNRSKHTLVVPDKMIFKIYNQDYKKP